MNTTELTISDLIARWLVVTATLPMSLIGYHINEHYCRIYNEGHLE